MCVCVCVCCKHSFVAASPKIPLLPANFPRACLLVKLMYSRGKHVGRAERAKGCMGVAECSKVPSHVARCWAITENIVKMADAQQ